MTAGKIAITNPDGSENIIYEPTDKQSAFHIRTEPNVLFYGGRGSGKSMALRMEAHARALATPGFTYVILRRTFPELQRSHLVHIPREARLFGGSWNNTLKVLSYPNGSKGFFSQCSGEDDVLNLLSAEFAWAGFDELSTFSWDMFTKLSASVRVPIGSGLTALVRAATNPLGPSAYQIQKYFITKDVTPEEDPDYNPNDWFAIKANLEDNPHLDREQYLKRFSAMAAHVRKAWIDGDFALENALFDFKPTVQGKPWHVVNDIDLEKIVKNATIYRAIDNGWYPDPTIVLWIAHLGNRHIVLNEKIWYKTTAAEIASEIRAEDRRMGITTVATTFCDPTMDINTTADIKTLRDVYENNGVPMEPAINNREMFATVIHNALAEQADENTPRLQIYVNGRDGCPYLNKTIPQMRYDPKRPKAMDDHHEDHGVVALAYYLMSHAADARSSISQVKLRPWMKEKHRAQLVLGWDNVRGF